MPTLADIRAKLPDLQGLDDEQAISVIQQVYYPTVPVEQIAARLGYKPAASAALPERTKFAAINDTVIEAANAVAGGVGSIANFVAPGNRVSSFIDENIVKPGQESQSDRKKAINARLAQDISGAQGVGDQVGAALRYAKDDPAGLLGMAAGSFAIPLGAIKGAGMLAKSLGVAEGAATKAALAGGALTGAALSGGDAAGQAYEESLKAGATEEQAQAAARQASVIPAIVGGAGGMLGAERIFAGAKGFKGNAISRALKTGASEGAQEFGEEFATQYEANRAVAPYDGRDPMQGAVAAGTLGALAGAPIGMLTGAVSPRREDEPKKPAPTPEQKAAKVLAAGSVDEAIKAANTALDFKPEPAPAAKPEDLSLVGGDGGAPQGLAFEEDPRFANAPILRGGQASAAQEFGTQEAASIYIGEQGLLGMYEPVQANGRWGLRATPRLEAALKRNTIIPSGEASELTSTGDATEQGDEAYDGLPVGIATEIEPETVQADDLLTGDQMPYGSKTAANVRARREGLGPANVIEIPGAGWVVRPQPKTMGPEPINAQPAGTRGTTAADILKAPDDANPARTAGPRPADAGRGDGAGVLRDQPAGDVAGGAAAPSGQGAAGGGAAGPGGRGGALTQEPWQLTREQAAKDYPGDEYDRMLNRYGDLGEIPYAEVDRRARTNSMGQRKLWAKTRAQLEQEGKDAVKAARGDRAATNKLKGTPEFANWRLKVMSRQGKEAITEAERLSRDYLAVHKDRVQEALMEGKDVPAEVLADYPDLKRPTPNATAPAEKATEQSRVPEAAAPAQQNLQDRLSDARRIGKEAAERGDPRDPPEAFTGMEKQVWRAGWDQGRKIGGPTPQVPALDAAEKPRKTLQEGRTDAALDRQVRENGEITTRRQWVERKVAEGLKTRITQEDRIKPMSRMAYFRATNEEQREHERKIKAGGKKDVYWIGDYEVTKIEHDYAARLTAAQAATPPAKQGPTPQGATDEGLQRQGQGRREEVAAGARAQAGSPAEGAGASRPTPAPTTASEATPPAPAPTLAERVKQRRGEKGAARDTLTATPLSGVELSSLAVASPPAPSRTARDGRMEQLDAEEMEAEEAREATIRRLTEQGVKPTRESVGQKRRPAEEGGGYVTQYQWRLKDGDDRYLELTDAERDRLLASPLARSTATHKDPGQPAEPATAPVIAQALSKAAVKEALSRAAMKAEALRLVDAAIATAKDADDPDVRMYEATAPGTRMTEEQIAQYKRLQGQAREKYMKRLTEEMAAQHERAAQNIGYAKIKVPGDGEFKVLNTKERLAEFRKKVESSPGFKETRAPRAPVNSANSKADAFSAMVDDGDLQAALDYAQSVGIDPKTAKLSDVLRKRLDKFMRDEEMAAAVAAREPAAPAPQPEVDAAPAAEPVAEAPRYRVAAMVVGGKNDGLVITKEGARIHAQLGLRADDFPGMDEFDLGFVDEKGKFFTRTALGMDAAQYNAAVAEGRSPVADEARASYSRAALRAKTKRGAQPGAESPTAPARDDAKIELRKRLSVLKALKECIG